jgi:hypothetical protein
LQAIPAPDLNKKVSEKLEQLAGQGVEHVTPARAVKYTALFDEENRLIARIQIAGITGQKDALHVLMAWEDSASAAKSGQRTAPDSAWRFYDIQDLSSASRNAGIWETSSKAALAELAKRHQLAAEQEQDEGTSDEERAAQSYWEGFIYDEMVEQKVRRQMEMESDSDDSDAYWTRQASSARNNAQQDQEAEVAMTGYAVAVPYSPSSTTKQTEDNRHRTGYVKAHPHSSRTDPTDLRKASSSTRMPLPTAPTKSKPKSQPNGTSTRSGAPPSTNTDAATIQAMQGMWNLYRQLKASHHQDDEESRAAFLELAKQATLDRD